MDPMTVRHIHDEPSPSPSCVTVTIEMSFYFKFFFVVFLVLFATTHTNIDPLQVLSTMAPKKDRVHARGRSKSVALSACLVIGSDDERDLKYVPPGTSTLPRASRATRATPKKVVFGVVTTF